MNRAVVIRAAAGLAAYLKQTRRARGTVVIGYDARHKSDVFATDTAEVMRGAGLDAVVLPRPLPTPLLAFAIRHLGCIAGVDGDRVAQPARRQRLQGLPRRRQPDRAARRRRDLRADRRGRPSVADVPRADGWRVLDEDIVDAYVDAVAALPIADSPRDLTAGLHAAARRRRRDRRDRAGAGRFRARRSWCPSRPSPTPTSRPSASPTPRSPARWISRWRWPPSTTPTSSSPTTPTPTGARSPSRPTQGWRMLRGDEVGALLADHLLRRGITGVFATTIVSSSLLGRMAEAHGVEYGETLTGFKWIGRVPGPRLRLRGGARLLRRAGPGPRQGRRLGAAASRRARRGAEGAGPQPARPARRHRARVRRARHRPAVGPRHRPVADRRGHAAAARRPADAASAASRSSGPTTSARAAPTCRRPTACATPRRRRPGRRPPIGHRAEDQVLPRGRRAGRRRRRRARGSPPPDGWTRSAPTSSAAAGF